MRIADLPANLKHAEMSASGVTASVRRPALQVHLWAVRGVGVVICKEVLLGVVYIHAV